MRRFRPRAVPSSCSPIATRLEHVLVYGYGYGWIARGLSTPGRRRSRFARGWHCLGLADTFRDGDPPRPHAVQAFGTKLVVFADAAGELHVLDAYCRHMGGDLTMGTVKGDQVACPFHDWRWGGDGRCAQIPYARRVPPAARTRSWLTLERNGQLFVWHDPEGNPPPDDVTIPRIEGAYSAGVDRLDLGLDPGGRRELPRGHRQRRGHGALLLHPLRVPDVLQERLRGARRHAVPADQVAARRRGGVQLLRREEKPPSVRKPRTSARPT